MKSCQYGSLENFLGKYLSKIPFPILQCIAEFVGTLFLVVFGCGSIHTSHFTGTYTNIFGTIIWGFGVSVAIYATAHISGGHLNPAISFAFALYRPENMSLIMLFPYVFFQFLGAMAGAGINYGIFSDIIKEYERNNNIVRGEISGVNSAIAYGSYFPNPIFIDADQVDVVSKGRAFFVESFGSGVLIFFVMALTDSRNKSLFKEYAPFFIGFTLAILIALYAPITGASLNPARDFGARLVSLMADWEDVAIPGPRDWFWMYIVAPFCGSIVGGFMYVLLLNPALYELNKKTIIKDIPPTENPTFENENIVELEKKEEVMEPEKTNENVIDLEKKEETA